MPQRRRPAGARRKAGRRGGAASLRKKGATYDRERARRQRVEESLREMNQRVARSVAAQKRRVRALLDGQLQALYALGLGLEATRSLIEVSPRQASSELARATSTLNDLIQQLRSCLANLDLAGR